VTLLHSVATLFRASLQHPHRGRHDLTSLRGANPREPLEYSVRRNGKALRLSDLGAVWNSRRRCEHTVRQFRRRKAPPARLGRARRILDDNLKPSPSIASAPAFARLSGLLLGYSATKSRPTPPLRRLLRHQRSRADGGDGYIFIMGRADTVSKSRRADRPRELEEAILRPPNSRSLRLSDSR